MIASLEEDTMKINKHVYSFSLFVFPMTRYYAELWSIALVPSKCVFFFSFFFPKDEKVGSGTGKRMGGGGIAPRTEKDLNENNQKAIVTKEISGRRINNK